MGTVIILHVLLNFSSACVAVSVKTIFPGKSFPTLQALELSFPSVGEDVSGNKTLLGKCLPAVVTLVVPATSVGGNVFSGTTLASQPYFAKMGEEVSGNGSLGGAHFLAVVTSVGPHAWGCPLLLAVPPVRAAAATWPHTLHCNTSSGHGQSCQYYSCTEDTDLAPVTEEAVTMQAVQLKIDMSIDKPSL